MESAAIRGILCVLCLLSQPLGLNRVSQLAHRPDALVDACNARLPPIPTASTHYSLGETARTQLWPYRSDIVSRYLCFQIRERIYARHYRLLIEVLSPIFEIVTEEDTPQDPLVVKGQQRARPFKSTCASVVTGTRPLRLAHSARLTRLGSIDACLQWRSILSGLHTLLPGTAVSRANFLSAWTL